MTPPPTPEENPVEAAFRTIYEAARHLLEPGEQRNPLLLARALSEVASMAEAEARDTVAEAVRIYRYHWTAVGRVFGITRQAAQKRFSRPG